MKATIFIPTTFIESGYGSHKMMSFEQIKGLDKDIIEIGLHSHNHQNFRDISLDEMQKDLHKNIKTLSENNISFTKVLAYPYGKYPKKKREKEQLFEEIRNLGIDFAVRIGNRINLFPASNPYELCRIDIRGNDHLTRFKLKLIFGKLKLF